MESKDRQTLFVMARSSGSTIAQAATIAGVSEMTAHRWLKQPDVLAALSTRTREHIEVIESATDKIQKLYTEKIELSCSVVIAIAEDTMAPAQARLKAVQMIQERVAPLQTTNGVDGSGEQTESKGIDWSMFTQAELDILYPIFQAAEARARASEKYA